MTGPFTADRSPFHDVARIGAALYRLNLPVNSAPHVFARENVKTSIVSSGGSLINNANLISKVYFPQSLLLSLLVVAVLLATGIWYFRNTERTFADVI